MRTAVVVGASGFVGRHLVEVLRARHWRVVAVQRLGTGRQTGVHNSDVKIVKLADPAEIGEVLSQSRAHSVFHLAAHQSRGHGPTDIDQFVEANLRLGMHIFGASANHRASVVSALSFFQFQGGQPKAHSLYSATKQAQLEMARYWREVVGADIRDVVLYDNYGPGDERSKLIPSLLHAVASDQEVAVGPLEQKMNLLQVRDVANGLIAVADDPARGPFTVRSISTVTVGEVIETIGRLAGRKVRAVVDDSRVKGPDPSTAGEWPTPLGWRPQISLEQGLKECLD